MGTPAAAALIVSYERGHGVVALTNSMPTIMTRAKRICSAMGTRHCAEEPLIQKLFRDNCQSAERTLSCKTIHHAKSIHYGQKL